MGPCFFLLQHSFASPITKPRWTMSMDKVGLKICPLGTSNAMVTLPLFPWCKPKWSQDNSTSNHKFYRALGQLHGPWCKQPITNFMIFVFLASNTLINPQLPSKPFLATLQYQPSLLVSYTITPSMIFSVTCDIVSQTPF